MDCKGQKRHSLLIFCLCFDLIKQQTLCKVNSGIHLYNLLLLWSLFLFSLFHFHFVRLIWLTLYSVVTQNFHKYSIMSRQIWLLFMITHFLLCLSLFVCSWNICSDLGKCKAKYKQNLMLILQSIRVQCTLKFHFDFSSCSRFNDVIDYWNCIQMQ